MPVEDAADRAGMFAAADFAVAGTWRAGGAGAGVAVNVILDQAQETTFGAAGIGTVAGGIRAMLQVSEAPGLARGDTIEAAGLTFRVETAEADIDRVIWTAALSETE